MARNEKRKGYGIRENVNPGRNTKLELSSADGLNQNTVSARGHLN